MGKQGENKINGFQRGLQEVCDTRPKAEYDRCLAELREVILSTEMRGCSVSSFYNKRYGNAPLTVSEEQKIAEVFAKYGVTEWQGNENENQNQNGK